LFRIILTPGVKKKGGNNVLHGAAIIIFNPALTVLARDDLTCDNFVVVNVSMVGNQKIQLISAYFKYREPTINLADI